MTLKPHFSLENFKTTPIDEMHDLYRYEIESLIGIINAKERAISTNSLFKNELSTSLIERVSRHMGRLYLSDSLEEIQSCKGAAVSLLNFGREMGFVSFDTYNRLTNVVHDEYNTALRRCS